MDFLRILQKYYDKNSDLYKILIVHSRMVTNKAMEVVKKLPNIIIDIDFVKEAIIIHDIGIYKTNKPEIGCNGKYEYICHGYLGADIMREEGYEKHALVCERHVGVGISIDDIQKGNLPLPFKNMVPISIEEQIICFADKFFSKNPNQLYKEKTIDEAIAEVSKYGQEKADKFNNWLKMFKYK